MQFGHSLLRAFLEGIRHGDGACCFAVHGHQHGRLGLGLQPFHFRAQAVEAVAARPHHAQVPDRHLAALHLGFHAVTRLRLEPRRFAQGQAAPCCLGPDGLAQRVLAALLYRGRQPQKLICLDPPRRGL